MILEYEDYPYDDATVGRAISWREGLLLSLVFHLSLTIVILVAPKWLPKWLMAKPAPQVDLTAVRAEQAPRFVFVAPNLDLTAKKPPIRGENSDKDRLSQAPERSAKPTNPLPYARGNSPERVEAQKIERPRGRGEIPDPGAGQPSPAEPQSDSSLLPRMSDATASMTMPTPRVSVQSGNNGRAAVPGGALGDALKNLQKYVQQNAFDNQGGDSGQFGPAIQFDTKGVEFGPWIRRFIAQIKRNWFIPYAAMSMKGHVVMTFNVHKDGSITDLAVAGPCPVDAFNNAAFNALAASNPTQPLPPEYPTEKAFFTVTFFYNETPP